MSAPETPAPRPAQQPVQNALAYTIVAQLAMVANWILGQYLPAEMPDDVRLAVYGLVTTGIAFPVAYIAARLRNTQWIESGQVTGLKKLLVLPLLLALTAPMAACAAIPLPGISQAAPVRDTPATRYYAAQGAFNTAVAAATAFVNARRADGSPLLSSEAADQIVEAAELGRDLILTIDALLDRCAPWIPNPETGETPVVAVLGEAAAPPPAECQELEGTLAAARAELAAGAARVASRTAAAGAVQ